MNAETIEEGIQEIRKAGFPLTGFARQKIIDGFLYTTFNLDKRVTKAAHASSIIAELTRLDCPADEWWNPCYLDAIGDRKICLIDGPGRMLAGGSDAWDEIIERTTPTTILDSTKQMEALLAALADRIELETTKTSKPYSLKRTKEGKELSRSLAWLKRARTMLQEGKIDSDAALFQAFEAGRIRERAERVAVAPVLKQGSQFFGNRETPETTRFDNEIARIDREMGREASYEEIAEQLGFETTITAEGKKVSVFGAPPIDWESFGKKIRRARKK